MDEQKRPRTYTEDLTPLVVTLNELLKLRYVSHATHHSKLTEAMQVVSANILHMLANDTTPTYVEVEAILKEAAKG